MPQPYNYLSPMQPMKEAFSLGELTQLRQVKNQERAAMQKQQAQATMLSDYEALPLKPSVADYQKFSLKYPDSTAGIKPLIASLKTEQRETMKNDAIKIYLAAKNGKTEVAVKFANERAEALKNSGKESEAGLYSYLSSIMDGDHESAEKNAGFVFSGTFGKEFLDGIAAQEDIRETGADIENKEAETKQVLSNIGINEAKLKTLNPLAQKIINDSGSKAVDKYKLADRSEELAVKYDNLVKSSGVVGQSLAQIRKLSGYQTVEDEIRTTYKALKAKGIVESLPPGVASDTDIKLVSDGFPNDDAPAEILSSFLRGLAKIQRYEGQAEEVKALWAEANTTLGKSKKAGTEIMGIKVPKGMSYPEFMKKNGKKIYDSELNQGGVVNPAKRVISESERKSLSDYADSL